MDDVALLSALGDILDEEAAREAVKAKPRRKQASKAVTPPVPAVPYQPTEGEVRTVAAWKDALRQKTPMPAVKIDIDGDVRRVGLDHPNQELARTLVMQAVGTTSIDFYVGILASITEAARRSGEADVQQVNFTMSFIHGMQPRDEAEALMAAQMAGIHTAVMTATRRLAHVDNLAQLEANSNALNKLARTYAAQMTALKQYRSTGTQTVTVQHQHVNVSDGGQAIVGDVHHGGGGVSKKSEATS